MDRQERIERAVVDLDGVWPDKTSQSQTNDFRGYYVGPLSDGLFWSAGDGSKREAICTYPEFMEARKRLEGRKMDKIDWSEAPEGATHAAVANERGRVCWYKKVPGSISSYKYMYSCGCDSDEWQIGFAGQPAHGPLEPRPQPDKKEGDWCSVGKRVYIKAEPENARIQWDIDQIHEDKGVLISSILGRYWKCRTELEPVVTTLSNARAPKKGQGLPPRRSKEGEGVEWDGGLPPVGAECEYKRLNVHYRSEFIRVSPIFFSDQICVLEHAMSGNQFAERLEDCEFRPIQSHRDKVIEAADEVWQHSSSKCTHESFVNLAVDLYDAGLLNDKRGDQ